MPGAKLQPNNPVNDPDLKPVKGYSKFKPNMSLYKTHTFGLIEPHLAIETVPGDKNFSYRSGTDVDTQNLKAPLMTPVKMHKDTFFVPLQAIIPKNADLIITNPLSGDDVDAHKVGPNWTFSNSSYRSMHRLAYMAMQALRRIGEGYSGSSGTNAFSDHQDFLTHLVYSYLAAYQVAGPLYSYGSLAQSLGYNFAGGFYGLYKKADKDYMTWDEEMDYLAQYIFSKVAIIDVVFRHPENNPGYYQPTWSASRKVRWENGATREGYWGTTRYVSFRGLLEILNAGEIIYEVTVYPKDITDTDIAINDPDIDFTQSYVNQSDNQWMQSQNAGSEKYFNISRLVAYQILIASFYTDDAVDYVYNAQLWHDNQKCLMEWALQTSSELANTRFVWNGIKKDYDCVAGAIHDLLCQQNTTAASNYAYGGSYSTGGTSPDTYGRIAIAGSFYAQQGAFVDYYLNIFGYQRSLRYRDYFVGSRPYPLAVGDVSVAVNSNLVDVVDVTKKIQMQRFLNQVNRVGRRIREYTAGIFGVATPSTHDEPIFLSAITTSIGAEETQNTGIAQLTQAQTTTSKLRKDTSNFVFSTDFNEFGVVIGVTYFDAVRAYVDGLDRQIMHTDRFEMFNPYLQHIGDQPISNLEINPSEDTTLGYKLRYSEYKQRTDRMAGGFVGTHYLPGFAFPVSVRELMNPVAQSPLRLVISPDFIRTRPHEFDKFFNVLSNYSPAGYFHFIIRHDNEVTIDRPMEAAPSIL